MASDYLWNLLSDLRGGRNAADDPLSLAENQVQEARNGDWYRSTFFRKRGGATKPSIGSVFTAVISSLLAHSPSNNPASSELWGVDSAATPNVGRMAGATTFSAVTLKDNIASSTAKVRGVSFNGKFFLYYDSAVDRSHVYDPNLSSPSVRRVGLDTPAAPTAANTGAGTYPATIRYYRVRYRIKNGSVVVAQSEPGASLSFTPSGTGTHARVTKPAAISEDETHWVLEASDDDVTFYELVETAVGTTTYDDNTTVADYADGDVSPVAGTYTKPTSHKYGIAAFNRILTAGSWESGGKQSRVWFTPASGTADKADDERIPNTTNVRNWFDLDESTGGDVTGFAGILYGAVYVFKYSQIRKVLPTGSSSPPFSQIEISLTRGALEQECICVGEDNQGRPCIYFMDSQVGPMTVGPTPPMEIGQGVRDQWDSVNLAATAKVGQIIHYRALGQVWFWWATGSSNDPTVLAKYTIATGAWSVDDTGGKIRKARCAVMFARTLGASMSRDLVPYVGVSDENNTLLKCNTSDTSDDSTAFQAVIKTKPLVYNNGKPFRCTSPWIVAKAASGVTLTITADRDFGAETRTATVDLTPTASETRVMRRVDGLDFADLTHLALSVGDASAVANSWQVDRIYIPVAPLEALP